LIASGDGSPLSLERAGSAAKARIIADLCRLAGADEDQIPHWIEEGRRRVEARRMPPFSQPDRRPPPRG